MNPARKKWWDDVVSADVAHYYGNRDDAALAAERAALGKTSRQGRRGSLIWGDRVRILEKIDEGNVARVSARGADYPNGEMWMSLDDLGGKPLLEVYVIDVGQGDGLLVVTPEGHHLMVDGGNLRGNQQGGKNAADFVDWKFTRDYLSHEDRRCKGKSKIRLDAIVASHNDQDHFGGLLDLLDLEEAKNRAELRASGVEVDAVYHAGLSWWVKFKRDRERKVKKDRYGKPKLDRTLGPTKGGHYVRLLRGRTTALAATKNLDCPDEDTLRGSWGRFIKVATAASAASKDRRWPRIKRISATATPFLPGFGQRDRSAVKIRVLGPIEGKMNGKPALRRLPDGESKNTNGHSIVLRLDYGDRRILLTGDLNTHSQNLIMDTYGKDFVKEFGCDVAKGCHHGSHDVSYRFLDGLRAIATVISSGDAETHDHPRPTIVAASATTGRKLVENDSMVAPLIYITEVARSVSVTDVGKMGEYSDGRPKYEEKRPKGAKQLHDTEAEMSRFRLFLGSKQSSAFDWPRLDCAKVVRGIRYGLVNVRTDGRRLFFAQLEERGNDWSVAALSEEQIAAAC